MAKPLVARIWQGRTLESIAETYADYLYDEGVKKLRSTKGNLGVQVFCQVRDGTANFMTISYWGSRHEIRAYAGEDIDKTHHLAKDPEYLLELPPYVQHFDILVNEWGRATPRKKKTIARRSKGDGAAKRRSKASNRKRQSAS